MSSTFQEIMQLIEQRIQERLAEPEKNKIQLIGRRKRK